MRKKKILSAVISAAMAVGCISVMPQTEVFEPMTAEAVSYSETLTYGDYLTYQKIDEDIDGTYDSVEITKSNKSITEIDIPSEIEGLPVKRIGNGAFYECSGLTRVTIPDSVTIIDKSAFYNCSALTSITIGDNVTSIGDSAFYNCDGITIITLPDSLTTIEVNAFVYCSGLTSITIPENVTNIGNSAFFCCLNLKSIVFENPDCIIYDSSQTILNDRYKAIYYYKGTICGYDNSTAQAYADKYGYAFESLDKLPAVTAVTTGPSETTNTTVSTTVSSEISGSDLLTYEKIDRDGNGTYDYVEITGCDKSATEIDIPSEIEELPVNSIGYKAFSYYKNLTSVTIPDSVINIKSYAFNDCSALTSVTLGNGVTSIGEWAFDYCASLTDITLPDSVRIIGNNAFSSCSNLSSITIENPGCEIYLSSYTIPYGTIYGYSNSTAQAYAEKYGCKFVSLDEPTSSTITKPLPADQGNLSYVKVDKDADGNYDYIKITACNTTATSIEIPSEIDGLPVTSIGDYAFNTCAALENITIPESITSIGANAFGGTPWLQTKIAENPLVIVNNIVIAGSTCSGDVVIPDGVTSIAGYAFSLAFNVTSITIPDSVKSIGDYAFFNCDRLESVTIPNSVTSIGKWAFYLCGYGLKSITLPESVSSIGDHAFYECNGLESLTIENPNCKIFNSEATIKDDATIYGYSDSTAQTYAEKYDREFISLGEAPVITTTVTTEPNETTQTTISAIGETTNTSDSSVSTSETPAVTTATTTIAPTDLPQGDANGDGETNIRDAAFIATALANGEVDKLPPSADFNGDGKTNIRDAAGMAAALANGEI